jgi:KaiC/GvpD/RAD55 family RecA-like ATPase
MASKIQEIRNYFTDIIDKLKDDGAKNPNNDYSYAITEINNAVNDLKRGRIMKAVVMLTKIGSGYPDAEERAKISEMLKTLA